MKSVASVGTLAVVSASGGGHPYQQPPPWAEFAFSTDYSHRSKLFEVSKHDGFLDYLGTNDAADCPMNLKFECTANSLPNCANAPGNSTLHPDFDDADRFRDGCVCGPNQPGTGQSQGWKLVCAFGQACDRENLKCTGQPFSGGTIAGANPGRKYPSNTHDDKKRPSCNSDTENGGVACGYTGRFEGVHNFTDFTEGDSLSQQPSNLSTQVLTEEQTEWYQLWDSFPINEHGEKILTDDEYAMMTSHRAYGGVGCNNPEAGDHNANLPPMTRRQALERAAGWLGMGTMYAEKAWAQAPCALETCGSGDDPADCPRFSYLAVCQGYKDMAHRGTSSGISAQKQLEVSKPPFKSGVKKVCRPADSVTRSGHTQMFRKWHIIDGIKYMEVWQMGGGYGKVNRRLQIWTPQTHVVHCSNRHTPFVEEDDFKSEWDYTVCHSTKLDVARDLNISVESVQEMISLESQHGDDPPLPRFESCAPAPAPLAHGTPDKMCGQDDIYAHKHASAEDCRSFCENDSKCNFWTFYGNSWWDEKPYCEFATTCTMELAPPNVFTYQSSGLTQNSLFLV